MASVGRTSQSSGVPDWDDARQLVGRKLMAKVKLIEATELYPEKNDIVRWNKKMETADDMPFQNQEPQQAPQQATAPTHLHFGWKHSKLHRALKQREATPA